MSSFMILVYTERERYPCSEAWRRRKSRGQVAGFQRPRLSQRRKCIPLETDRSGVPGVSPRMHWRRGHWRAQLYGERHLLRKLIWIEPTLVTGQSADEQPALSA